jgi:hypothetical protein
LGCSKFRFIQSKFCPKKKQNGCERKYYRKKKKETQSLQLLLILNWKAIEKDQFRERLHEKMG